jgi:hypothetical protein
VGIVALTRWIAEESMSIDSAKIFELDAKRINN